LILKDFSLWSKWQLMLF